VTLRVIVIVIAISCQVSGVRRQPSSNMSPPKSCCSCPGTMSREQVSCRPRCGSRASRKAG